MENNNLNNEIDLLIWDIAQMCTTNNKYELEDKFNLAQDRLNKLKIYNDERIKSLNKNKFRRLK